MAPPNTGDPVPYLDSKDTYRRSRTTRIIEPKDSMLSAPWTCKPRTSIELVYGRLWTRFRKFRVFARTKWDICSSFRPLPPAPSQRRCLLSCTDRVLHPRTNSIHFVTAVRLEDMLYPWKMIGTVKFPQLSETKGPIVRTVSFLCRGSRMGRA